MNLSPSSALATPQSAAPLTRRDSNNLFVIALLIQNIILLIIGSSPLSLLCLTVIELICYQILSKYGSTDINSGIILSIGLVHIIIASFLKIFLIQSLDDNLIIPELAEFITLTYFLTLTMAFLVVRRLPVPTFGRSPEPTIRTLEALIVISTFLMLLPLVGRSGADTDAINGQVNFLGVATRGFPTVAMVASIVRALKKSNGAKIMDAWSASVLGTGIVLGLAGNSREGVFAPILAALVTPLFYGYRVKFQTMIIVAAAVAFVTLFISPALLIVRSERDFLSFSERIEKTTETIGLLIIRDPATIEATQRPLDYITYSVWGRYFGEPIPFSDRIGLIQTTDALASTAYGSSYVTIGDSFDDMVKSLFPNFVLAWFDLYVERTKTAADRVASSLGLADTNAASFLAIPLDAESFATGGIWAVVRDSFLTYALIFYVLRLATGQNRAKGVLPISLLLISYHVCSEGDAGAIFYYSLRIVPQFVISFYFVQWLARLLGSSRSPVAI